MDSGVALERSFREPFPSRSFLCPYMHRMREALVSLRGCPCVYWMSSPGYNRAQKATIRERAAGSYGQREFRPGSARWCEGFRYILIHWHQIVIIRDDNRRIGGSIE